MSETKEYDRSYFARWYHDRRTRVHSPDDVARKVRLVVGITEYLLERELRSVLDIGCGEGAWFPVLRRMRPRVRYLGVDASEYAARRYGKRRHIRRGRFGGLDASRVRGSYDLVVCSDMLHYVPTEELERGVREIAQRLHGVAYLEAFTVDDHVIGDTDGWQHRTPAHYRQLFGDAGLTAIGMHCWVGPDLVDHTTALERAT